jgi:2-methylaconitate cis-trans-isomerase PrpF
VPSINREKSNETIERTPSASKHAMITRTASAQMDVDFQGMQVHC